MISSSQMQGHSTLVARASRMAVCRPRATLAPPNNASSSSSSSTPAPTAPAAPNKAKKGGWSMEPYTVPTHDPGVPTGLEQRFQDSYTMSQVYVTDRPAAIPHSEHDRRRRVRDLEEITSAGKKRGVSAQLIASNLEQVEALLPGLVNLHKAKAADWLLILSDVNAFTAKLILLRELFPSANLQKVLSSQPKLMLKTQEQLQKDAAQVRKILSSAPNPDAIIEACPDLINPISLIRSLSYIQSSFGGIDPVEVLVKHPDVLMNMGEANIADSAEYGELSTKD